MAPRGNKRDEGADEILAACLAVGQTVKRAAREAGLGYRTAWRRLACPEFRAKVAALRNQVLSEATGKLSRLAGKAAMTAAGLLDSADERVRLSAADTIMKNAIRLREHAELAERIARLEESMLTDHPPGDEPQ